MKTILVDGTDEEIERRFRGQDLFMEMAWTHYVYGGVHLTGSATSSLCVSSAMSPRQLRLFRGKPVEQTYTIVSGIPFPPIIMKAAKLLKTNRLGGEIRDSHPAHALTYVLSWINDGDGVKAVQRLEQTLREYPGLFRHSYVEALLDALQEHGSPESMEWYFRLGRSWLEAETRYRIRGTKPKIKVEKRGPLFPDRLGGNTKAAQRVGLEAGAYAALIEDVRLRITNMGRWPASKREYKRCPKIVIEERALDVQSIITQFKKQHRLPGKALTEADCEAIVKAGYESIDPIDSITCALVATLMLAPFQRVQNVLPGLIHSSREDIIRRTGQDFPQVAAYMMKKEKDPYSVLRIADPCG